MAGLFRNNPETPEGKYPIALRRDGTPLESRFIVMVLKDPGAGNALRAYAASHHARGSDPQFVGDFLDLADQADGLALTDAARSAGPTSDPDAPRHRKDDPAILAWARSIGCPGS